MPADVDHTIDSMKSAESIAIVADSANDNAEPTGAFGGVIAISPAVGSAAPVASVTMGMECGQGVARHR